ncbi:cytochrome C [Geovibrio thiophilus]|nr:cytochrome C [Geovibrio thiophilus]
MMRIFFLFTIMAAGILLGTLSAHAASIVPDDENCMMCHKYPGLSRVSDEGYLRQFYVDSDRYTHSVHTKVKCSGCHTDIKEIPHKEAKIVDCAAECHITMGDSAKPFSHSKIVEELKGSIHNVDNEHVNARIAEDFPTCTDCHSNPTYRFITDDVRSVHDARSQDKIFQKCSVCHDQDPSYKHYFNHVTHRIKNLSASEDVVKTCSKCHSRDDMAEKHKLKNAASTYLDTFHGKAVEFGMENAPTCIDCHVRDGQSVHKILSHKSPDSATYVENRYKSCEGEGCHANTTREFGLIRMHVVIDKDLYPIEFWVALAFTVLTLGVFFMLQGLMILELIRIMFPKLSFRRKRNG